MNNPSCNGVTRKTNGQYHGRAGSTLRDHHSGNNNYNEVSWLFTDRERCLSQPAVMQQMLTTAYTFQNGYVHSTRTVSLIENQWHDFELLHYEGASQLSGERTVKVGLSCPGIAHDDFFRQRLPDPVQRSFAEAATPRLLAVAHVARARRVVRRLGAARPRRGPALLAAARVQGG